MDDEKARELRKLPSVSTLLADNDVAEISSSIRSEVATLVVRDVLDQARAEIRGGGRVSTAELVARAVDDLRALTRASPARVINGSGVIIQTNLGRSPVSIQTGSAMRQVAEGYVALETDLRTGERGGRGSVIEAQVRALTGAERTLVVNNNAAAVFLMLSALCDGMDVIVSRGEAVEIGGGFRIPDVLRESGARLVEVGTTNRTYARDYAAAVTADTAALLKVHTSNFAMIGFTATPAIGELADAAHDRSILLLEDAGSGCLLETSHFGLQHEPTLGDSLDAGVDIVCASGDKLLGGPQAGLILGKKALVDRIARHPLARALRADKTCLAGISATLSHYLRGDATESIPVWWSISRSIDWLEGRAHSWARELGGRASVVKTEAVVGGGSLPGSTLPSRGVTLHTDLDASSLAARLRTGPIPVVPRIVDDRVIVDARTVLSDEDESLLDALQHALN